MLPSVPTGTARSARATASGGFPAPCSAARLRAIVLVPIPPLAPATTVRRPRDCDPCWRSRSARSSMTLIRVTSSRDSIGLTRYSSAPNSSARTLPSMPSTTESTTICVAAPAGPLRIRSQTMKPSTSGIMMSRRTRSGRSFSTRATPSLPPVATCTSKPAVLSSVWRYARLGASSSMTAIRAVMGL